MPKETFATADLASLPAWVEAVARERREAPGRKGRARLAATSLLVTTLAFLIFIDTRPTNDPSTWVLLVGMIASIPLIVVLSRWVTERAAGRRRDRELDRLEALGETTLGGDFVGVAYADRAWTYPGFGDNVDEGILRIDLDRLVFVGRHARFELPAVAVVSTEIRRHDAGTGERLRLYVAWAEGGEAGTFSVALPYRRSARRRMAETEELRERIERWRTEPFPRRQGAVTLPPSFEPTKKINPYERVGRPAKLLAGVSLFAVYFALMVAFEVGFAFIGRRDHHMSGGFGIVYPFGMWLWVLLAAKIEARLPERWRYREPETKVEAPNLGGARAHDDPETISVGH